MGNWLQKVFPPPAVPTRKSNLPATDARFQPQRTTLPNASIVYGIGASLLFVAAFFFLISGRWFVGLGVLALGACLTGFAIYLMKNPDA